LLVGAALAANGQSANMHKKLTVILSIIAIVVMTVAITNKRENSLNAKFEHATENVAKHTTKGRNMKLTSVFEHNRNIPSIYTCDGEDLAPELSVSEIPENTKELALIVDDPDAPMGTWVHWIIYNLPSNTTKIDAKNLPVGSKQGMTNFGRIGWGGPCPPNGAHRYFFKLYALDKKINLPEEASKSQLEEAIKNNIIEKVELIGIYKRK